LRKGNVMGRLGSTWMLMKASWNVVRNNKRLLVLPLFSGICLLLVLASFALPVLIPNLDAFGGAEDTEITLGVWTPPGENAAPLEYVRFYGMVFAFYFANYFVMIFFNSAVVASALFWMRDGNSSLSKGLAAAVKRLPQIVGWALLSATVGLILKVIENSNKRAGAIVAWLLGTAWTVTTYLVVPVLVVEGKGPIAALKESTSLLKKSWGQQLVGGFAMGLVYALLFFLGLAGLGAGAYVAFSVLESPAVFFVFLAAFFVYVGLLILSSSVQTPIFQAALYTYAKEGKTSGSFGEELLQNAFRSK
jgi:hypothetical protein